MKSFITGILASAAIAALIQIPASGQDNGGIKEVRKINTTAAEIVFGNGDICTIDFYGPEIFRMFQDNSGGIVRDPEADPPARILADSPRRDAGKVTAALENGTAVLTTPEIKVEISGGSVLTVTDLRTGDKVIEGAAPAEFGSNRVKLTLKNREGEYFYGGGVQNGRFSHAGEQIAIENTNNWVDGGVASPTPFYWSTEGYGMMWHSFRKGLYDFGNTDPEKVVLSHDTGYLDVFFMVDSGAVALLNDFYQLTGHPVLIPKFGFYEGHLNAYNRDYWTEDPKGILFEDGKRYKESQKDNGGIKESLNGEKDNYQFSARAVVDRYAANDMPLGWILPNDGYGAGYGQTGTLDGNIRNLKDFGEYARSKGVEIGLWTQSDLHPKEGVEALLQRDIVKEVRDAGVRVLKTDVAWVGAGYSFGLNGVADVGEIMPYYGNDARPFIISLDGWAGTQRYATIWSGDQTGGDWEYIRFHIPTFIGSGLSGQPNITSDMDGIFGGNNMPVNIREFQWKAFTPMQLNMDGWGSTPKYPEVLGEPAASINRWYLKLKSEIMPYAYSIAEEATDGLPMIRAMFLEYPDAYTLGTATKYQYMYGPYFLVAPIYMDTRMDKDGNDVRNGIYLPEGKWIDYFTGDVYEGECIINDFDAPVWKLPVFVRSGAIIPVTEPNNNPGEIRQDYRAYELYPDGVTEFVEYDDDGRTQDYLRGKAVRTSIRSAVDGTSLEVAVSPAEGSYEGFVREKITEFRVNVSGEPRKVSVKAGGKTVKLTRVSSAEEFSKGENVWFYDEAPELNRFATPGSSFASVSIKKNPVLMVRTGKTDVSANEVVLNVNGFVFAPADRLRVSSGTLEAPVFTTGPENIEAYTVTPVWESVENADFYEIEFGGKLYSTIKGTELPFGELVPETEYTFRLRAVNKDGHSDWTTATYTTTSDPLEFAVKGIYAQASCADQPGSGIRKLVDFDEKSIWHSKWGEGTAVPFDITLDLKSVNRLDKIEYLPREDAGNGTILEGTVSFSEDKQSWSEPVPFSWERTGQTKTFSFAGDASEDSPEARYIRIHVSKAAGNFGSGNEMYVFRVPGTEGILQGDINRDKRIDDNDLTSYMNYTGLRSGDADFDYVSIGDINRNGLIDSYDISVVTTMLDGGTSANDRQEVAGTLTLEPDRTEFRAGDIISVKVSGKGLKNVNALSFSLPYDTDILEYDGMELKGMKEMVNLTYDRLHTDGHKALYPTFANKGNNFLLEGDSDLFVIRFKAKKDGTFDLKASDGMLVGRNLKTVSL